MQNIFSHLEQKEMWTKYVQSDSKLFQNYYLKKQIDNFDTDPNVG